MCRSPIVEKPGSLNGRPSQGGDRGVHDGPLGSAILVSCRWVWGVLGSLVETSKGKVHGGVVPGVSTAGHVRRNPYASRRHEFFIDNRGRLEGSLLGGWESHLIQTRSRHVQGLMRISILVINPLQCPKSMVCFWYYWTARA